jgi:hypothetical protein
MRRLIVFSDPGGAKPCLALAQKWSESDEVMVCSDRHYAFFEMFGIPVRHCAGTDAVAIFNEFQPENLYTGTSYTSRIEMEFVRESVACGIPSTSFVDHYTRFRERFEFNGSFVLPDQIDVLDERARNLAMEAGLPANALRVTGNPYHEFLKSWRSGISKEELWKKLGVPLSNAQSILFAPDPLSNAGGVEKFGNDEMGILKLLLDVLGELGNPVQLLVKAHPNQSMDYLKAGLQSCPPNVNAFLLGPESDALLNDLIQHSTLVVGMFSNLLIEAHLLGASTLRILSDLKMEDPLKNQNLGPAASTPADLQLAITKLLLQ